ncbi:hypothetical protein SCLARK_001677 [Spiroplasma clarkii]|uniref:hypothetical protein n=1 Tax=Spiroplasma clarkii TaxID=2139 RepID=UPI000B5762D2|nr:hypothetical protein [Spiroplasma clarkii]ARU92143.1 hypothetical protein SCLARK_001677 [Spiroplasma clarkii]
MKISKIHFKLKHLLIIISILVLPVSFLAIFIVNFQLYSASLWMLHVGEYRTPEQKAWQKEIEADYQNRKLDARKNVILFSFDGIVWEHFLEWTLNDEYREKIKIKRFIVQSTKFHLLNQLWDIVIFWEVIETKIDITFLT